MTPGLYGLSALSPGDRYETGEVEVTAAMIDAFAALTGDASPLHMSEAAAQAAGFAGRIAHGLLVVSLIEGLKAAAPVQLATHTALGWEVTFRAPVHAGDRLRARVEVLSVRRVASKGLVSLKISGLTSAGEVLRATARYFGHFTR